MKTKNMILTAGLLGLAYLIYKNSKQTTDESTDDTSGGGGGGAFHLPPLPPLVNPYVAPINVVVTPIPRPFANPKPFGTKSEPRNLSQVEAPDVPATTNTNTGGSTGSSQSGQHNAGYTPASTNSAEQP